MQKVFCKGWNLSIRWIIPTIFRHCGKNLRHLQEIATAVLFSLRRRAVGLMKSKEKRSVDRFIDRMLNLALQKERSDLLC